MRLQDAARSLRVSGYRVLALAVLFSLAWHLFWIFAVKIVPPETGRSYANFSKVSFLGPILSKVSLGVRQETAKRSFLENRYSGISYKAIRQALPAAAEAAGKDAPDVSGGDTEKKMPYLVDDAVRGSKVEP